MMRIRKLAQRYNSMQSKFTIAWIILGISCFFALFYFQWHHLKSGYHQHLSQRAASIARHFDRFLYESLESINPLPPILNQHDCGKIAPQLQEAIFNNPILSGIIITNSKNDVLCATTKQYPHLPPPPASSPSLAGPFKVEAGTQEVFLLQQRIGEFHIGEFLLAKVIANFFRDENDTFTKVVLVDDIDKKELLTFSANEDLQTTNKFIVLRQPLRLISNIELLMVAPKVLITSTFLVKQLISALIFFIIYGFLYFYLSRVLCRRMSLSYALNSALRTNSFCPVYQPIWHNGKQQFIGAELLMRWKTEADETIMPDFFIDEAEKTGLIIPISLQLIKNAFMQSCELLESNPEFHLAINLSVQHFYDDNFFPELFALCNHCQVRSEQIIFELTERELLDKNQEIIIRRMEELRRKNFSLAVDDFGTGHASINYLRLFPFNYLKIDKIFVQAIGSGAVTETLNEAIINLANTLKLTIVAEGIETAEQFQFLKEHQVELMQGWHFAKAMEFDELLVFLERNKNG